VETIGASEPRKGDRILTIGIDPARNHLDLGLSDADVIEMYRVMVLTRRLDDRTWALNRQGRAPFVVSAAGHEGAQIGAGFALDRSVDWALPYYRDVGLALTLGMTPEDILLGVFSKATDPSSGGRQMPNHWSHPELRIFSQGSVIATQYPQAAGIAYELRRTSRPGVVLATGGEGSTSEGDFHEGMNFAGLKKLPVIFLIENNLYSISVPSDQQISGDLTDRALGYGIPAVSVDGNQVLDVYEAVKTAADRARAGGGPTFIEARTYRYYAHTSDDDDKQYRSAEEVEEWRKRDPITTFRQYLIEARLLDQASEDAIEAEATEAVAGAVERASAAPDAHDAFSMVYAKPVENDTPSTAVEPTPAGEEVNLVTAVNQALHEVMEAIPATTIFGEDVADPKGGVFRATIGLTDANGAERSFNTPIAESSIIGIGIGMAAAGGTPIAEIQFADFIHPAWNQIVSEAAKLHYRSAGGWNCPLVIRTPYGGGIHGALYHSQSIEGFYAHVPGLKVVVPSTPADVKGLLWSAIEDPDPVLFLEPKKLYRVPLGKASLRREGSDLAIIAYGTMAHFSMEAAEQLAAMGVEADVLDLRSIRPLDWVSIEAAVQRTGKILIVHEDNEFAGFGAEVAAQIAGKSFEWLDAPVRRYAAPEVPAFPFGAALEAQVMPSVEGIVARARELAEF